MILVYDGVPKESNWKSGTPYCRNIIGTTAALIGLGVASAAGGIGSAAIASRSAKNAAKTQSQAADRATAFQRDMYEQGRKDISPWREAGITSLDRLKVLLGLSGDPSAEGFGSLTKGYGEFKAPTMIDDPGYKFRLEEGAKGIERSSAARTGTLSGAAAKEMARYNQDFASGEYGNAYNRALQTFGTNFGVNEANQSNLFNRLNMLSSMGLGGAETTARFGQDLGRSVGENITGAGNATAAGQVASGNAWGNAIGGIGSNVGNIFLLQELLKKSQAAQPQPLPTGTRDSGYRS
jgi:hypothetical protein